MPTPQLDRQSAEEMAGLRTFELNQDIPQPQRGNFTSDEEYREALMSTYQALRMQQYEYTVLDEATKLYNLQREAHEEANSNGHVYSYENLGMWNDYSDYINARGITDEERARRQAQFDDCAASRGRSMAVACYGGLRTDYNNASCAITASSLAAQISDKMGYQGDDNIMIARRRSDHNTRNNIVSAAGFTQNDSIPQIYRIVPESIKGKNETLNQMMLSGKLHVGDGFSIKTGEADGNYSGCHAMTVAAIEYEGEGDNRTIKNYTIVAGNPRRLITINANGENNRDAARWANAEMKNSYSLYDWMQNNINDEAQALSRLSTEEMEARVAGARSNTLGTIESLQASETYNFEHGYYEDIAGSRGFFESATQYQARLETGREEFRQYRENMARDFVQPVIGIPNPGIEIHNEGLREIRIDTGRAEPSAPGESGGNGEDELVAFSENMKKHSANRIWAFRARRSAEMAERAGEVASLGSMRAALTARAAEAGIEMRTAGLSSGLGDKFGRYRNIAATEEEPHDHFAARRNNTISPVVRASFARDYS